MVKFESLPGESSHTSGVAYLNEQQLHELPCCDEASYSTGVYVEVEHNLLKPTQQSTDNTNYINSTTTKYGVVEESGVPKSGIMVTGQVAGFMNGDDEIGNINDAEVNLLVNSGNHDLKLKGVGTGNNSDVENVSFDKNDLGCSGLKERKEENVLCRGREPEVKNDSVLSENNINENKIKKNDKDTGGVICVPDQDTHEDEVVCEIETGNEVDESNDNIGLKEDVETENISKEKEDGCDDDHDDDDGSDDGGDDDARNDSSCCGDDAFDSDDADDISINDDEEDNSDDSSDIDVQSFLAQLDEEIAESENSNPAIDRGYAWIIVFAVFLIHFLLMGYLKSGGVFFVEFQRRFKSSASMTSLIIGLVDGIFSISSPFVLGYLIKVSSVRQMSLVGSFLFVCGVVANAACERIELLILTHSLCFGLANGLMYGPSIVIINEYFTKRRALALSLATTGASCGGVVFPFLARYLFDSFGFGGGIIMVGGVIMQIFIASTLLIPVKHHTKNINNNKTILLSDRKDAEEGKVNIKKGSSIMENLKQRWQAVLGGKVRRPMGSKPIYKQSGVNESNSSIFQKHHQNHSAIHNTQHKILGTGMKSLQLEQFSSKLEICEEGIPLEIQSEYHTTDKSQQEPTKDVSNDRKHFIGMPGRYSHFLSATDKDNTSLSSAHSHLSGSVCSSAHPGNSRHRLDVGLYHNQNELDVYPSHASSLLLLSKPTLSKSKQTLSRSMMFQSTSTLNNTIADIISIDHDLRRIPRLQSPDNNNNNSGRNVSAFRRMLPMFCDSPLLRSASFWSLVPFNFAAAIGIGLSQIFVLPLAKERGLSDDQATFCLSLLNVMDILSHLAPGMILNFTSLRPSTVAIVPMAVVGIVGHLTSFFNSYTTMVCMSVSMGLCTGFFYTLQSLIVIDILGLENYTSAIGIYYLTCGLAGAISYPVAGALKDLTGTYTTTYQYLASMQFLAVALLIVLPFIKRFDVRRGVLKP